MHVEGTVWLGNGGGERWAVAGVRKWGDLDSAATCAAIACVRNLRSRLKYMIGTLKLSIL